MKEKQDKENRNQYHPPFVAAMKLELRKDRDQIVCDSEHLLNTLPNQIDLLVTKKDSDAKMRSGLGAIFKKYNLLEYKSPDDALNKIVYYRTMAYGYLYLAYEGKDVTEDEITFSFIRQRKPYKLFGMFRDMGFAVEEFESGIYYIKREHHISMQVIVAKELGVQYKWLGRLTADLHKEDLLELTSEAAQLTDHLDRVNALSVIKFVTELNKDQKWMEEIKKMSERIGLFKEEFEQMDREIEELQKQNDAQSRQISAQNRQIDTQKVQIDTQKVQIDTQREQIDTQRVQIDTQREQIDTQKVQIDTQREQICNQNTLIQMLQEKIERLEKLSSNGAAVL